MKRLEILRALAKDGFRIFSIDDVLIYAQRQEINPSYVYEMLSKLCKLGWIERIKSGIFSFTPESGLSVPPHAFEIAQSLVTPSAVSHWTAMHFHQLTQQTPNMVFSITPKRCLIPKHLQDRFSFARVKEKMFFGSKTYWIDHNTQACITDVERTLLDGLKNPDLCGDFHEVYNAFSIAIENGLNLKKIMDYSLQYEDAVIKRTGWILENAGIPMNKLKRLLRHPIKGYRKLNALGTLKGRHNSTWMIIVNI